MRSAYWRLFVVIVAALAVAGVVVAGSTVLKTVRAHVPGFVREAHAHADAGGSPSTWYDETYGTFAPKTVTGSGNEVVSVPAAGGLVTFTTASPHYEVLQMITVDGKDADAGDLYYDASSDDCNGAVTQGQPTAWAVSFPDVSARKLDIKATGEWKLALAPMSSAPELPSSGTGSGVFRYNGAAGTWASTFSGPTPDSGFDVCQSNITFPLNVYLGNDSPPNVLPHRAGPSIIVVRANGRWTLK